LNLHNSYPVVVARRPELAIQWLRRAATIASFLNVDKRVVRQAMKEPMGLVNTLIAEQEGRDYGGLSPKACQIFYALVKLAGPRVVVETGVSAGISSAMILSAIGPFGGKLFSVDIDEKVGLLVPNELRPHWTLLTGSSEKILPTLLAENMPIDLFFHDSDHSYENMMFEFHEAWKSLRPGGLLVTHDVSSNRAFRDFAAEIGLKRLELIDFGVIRKQ
jgi:predicted O-methyltransferase YrrM